jgi:ribosomal protein L7/L12
MSKTFAEIMAGLKTGTSLSGAYQINSGETDENTGLPVPKRIGVTVSFAEQGYGFGEMLIVQQGGKTFIDSENTEPEHVKQILGRLVDGAIFDWDDEPEKHRAWSEAIGRSCGQNCKLGCDYSRSKEVAEMFEQRPEARIAKLEADLRAANETIIERDRTIMALRAEIASTKVDPESAGFEFTKEEKELLKAKDKIGAIKSVRTRLGVDLVTAKRLCDRGRIF